MDNDISNAAELYNSGELFFRELFVKCGEDPDRQGLLKTPHRVIQSFSELTQGYRQSAQEILNDALFDCDNDAPVYIQKIPFYSLCEHHLLPFFGHCDITYLPNKKVIGLSKIHRIIDMFSKRLQIQERLTYQVTNTLFELTQAQGIRVEMQAEHLCVSMRGTHKINSTTFTSSCCGKSCPTRNPTNTDLWPTAELQFQTKEFPISLGCFPKEFQETTPVQIQVEVKFLTPPQACTSDRIEDTICYDHLSQLLYACCFKKHFNLIEHCGYEAYSTLKKFFKLKSISHLLRLKLTKKLMHEDLQQSAFQIGDF
jgi:GTP cyclohydrolase I